MTELRLPRRFWDDHALRSDDDLPEPIKLTAREVVVDLNPAQLADLLDDARHYDVMGYMGALDRDLSGLVASARATLKRIEVAGL